MSPAILWHVVATAAIGAGLLALGRWVRRQSVLVGTVVQLGILLRLAIGVAFFWTSYLGWQPLASFHTGDGFWQLAPDARNYFLSAAWSLETGSPVDPKGPSPVYVSILSWWLRLTGPTVPGAMLLNVVCYSVICALVVRTIDPRRTAAAGTACLVSVLAFTLSPALLLFGSQALKDQVFSLGVVLVAAGVCGWLELAGREVPARTVRRAGSVVLAAIGWYVLAGIRAYFVFVQLFVLAVVVFVGGVTWLRARSRWRLASEALVLILVGWTSFVLGAGAYLPYYERIAFGHRLQWVRAYDNWLLSRGDAATTAAMERLPAAGQALESAREGFIGAGGATNLMAPAVEAWSARHLGHSGLVVARVGVGLLALSVPVSVLRLSGLVEFTGGRGLLVVTDLDTVFQGLSALAVLAILWRAWPLDPWRSTYLAFTIGMGILLAGLIAYTVVNFGTLFRLRLMVATLVWLGPLAVASGLSDGTSRANRSDAQLRTLPV